MRIAAPWPTLGVDDPAVHAEVAVSSSETTATFRPYGVGYVELPGALRVETRLAENDPAKLRIGQEMEFVIYVHRTEPDGTEVMNYAFRPVIREDRP